jgi:hypothetical protein
MSRTTPAATETDRIASLERRLRRTQGALFALALAAAGAIMAAQADKPAATPPADVVDEVRTRKLVVVDDAGVARITIGQDAPGTQRRSRAAGITIRDQHGHERGGMGTMDDGSAVLALDAPAGVGSEMPDRAGIAVWPDGSAGIILIGNTGRTVAQLRADAEGAGGLQLLQWDTESGKVRTKTLGFDGETVTEKDIGG